MEVVISNYCMWILHNCFEFHNKSSLKCNTRLTYHYVYMSYIPYYDYILWNMKIWHICILGQTQMTILQVGTNFSACTFYLIKRKRLNKTCSYFIWLTVTRKFNSVFTQAYDPTTLIYNLHTWENVVENGILTFVQIFILGKRGDAG